jgi:hypothetical protein
LANSSLVRSAVWALVLTCLGGAAAVAADAVPLLLTLDDTLPLRGAAEQPAQSPEARDPAPARNPSVTDSVAPPSAAPGQLSELYEGFEAGLKPIQDISIQIDAPPGMQEMAEWIAEPGREYFDDAQPSLRDASIGIRYSEAAYGPALNFCYRPLYFEETNFERYGYHRRFLQPAISAAKFYRNTLLLPYRMLEQRPGFCTYYEHHYRPGAAEPPEWPDCCARSDTLVGRTTIGLQRTLFAP